MFRTNRENEKRSCPLTITVFRTVQYIDAHSIPNDVSRVYTRTLFSAWGISFEPKRHYLLSETIHFDEGVRLRNIVTAFQIAFTFTPSRGKKYFRKVVDVSK